MYYQNFDYDREAEVKTDMNTQMILDFENKGVVYVAIKGLDGEKINNIP